MARYPSREVYPSNWRDLRSWSAGAVGQYVVVFHLMNQERSSYFCYFCKECEVLVVLVIPFGPPPMNALASCESRSLFLRRRLAIFATREISASYEQGRTAKMIKANQERDSETWRTHCPD